MSTEVITDREVLGELDSEWEIPCDIPQRNQLSPGGWPPCKGDPARWVAREVCDCRPPAKPRYTLLCDHCKNTYEDWFRQGLTLSCIWCGKRGCKPPVPWFTPLKA